MKIDCWKVACMDLPFFDINFTVDQDQLNLTGLRSLSSRSVLNIFFEEMLSFNRFSKEEAT